MKRVYLQIIAICSLAVLSVGIPASLAADGITLKSKGRVETVDIPRQRFSIRLAPLSSPLALGWNQETQFLFGKKPATAAFLEPGQKVELRYRVSSNGKHHATRIAILTQNPNNAKAALKP